MTAWIQRLLLGVAAVVVVCLAACSSTPLTSSEVAGDKPPANFEGGPATPIPPGAALKPALSLILGQGDQWVGRMVLDVGRDADMAYKFFYEVYPTRGWNMVTAVRGEVSLLVFANAERSITVEVRQGNVLGGGTVVMTAAPTRSGGALPAATGAGPSATPLPVRRP